MKRFLHKDSQALRGAQCYMCVSCRHFGSSECIFVISYFSIFHKRQASKITNWVSFSPLIDILVLICWPGAPRSGQCGDKSGLGCPAVVRWDPSSIIQDVQHWNTRGESASDMAWMLLVVISAVPRQYLLLRSPGTGETVRSGPIWTVRMLPSLPFSPLLLPDFQ